MDECNWVYYDTDLGSCSYDCGELRHEFIRLCEEDLRLAKKFRSEDVFQEGKPKQSLNCITSRLVSLILYYFPPDSPYSILE